MVTTTSTTTTSTTTAATTATEVRCGPTETSTSQAWPDRELLGYYATTLGKRIAYTNGQMCLTRSLRK